jgi:hypothetical protein
MLTILGWFGKSTATVVTPGGAKTSKATEESQKIPALLGCNTTVVTLGCKIFSTATVPAMLHTSMQALLDTVGWICSVDHPVDAMMSSLVSLALVGCTAWSAMCSNSRMLNGM